MSIMGSKSFLNPCFLSVPIAPCTLLKIRQPSLYFFSSIRTTSHSAAHSKSPKVLLLQETSFSSLQDSASNFDTGPAIIGFPETVSATSNRYQISVARLQRKSWPEALE